MADDAVLKVTSSEFQKHIGKFQDECIRRPVMITRNGRARALLISAEEYDRLRRFERRVLAPADWTPEQIAALAKSKVPQGYEHLNAELGDTKT